MTDILEETPETIDVTPEIRNAKWNDSEHTSFDVELNHPEFGWIPFTVADGERVDTYCYKIWAIKDTLEIQEYVEHVKTLEEIKQELLQKISFESDKFENNKCDSMYITSSLGFRVNADRRSLQNVENLIRIGQETIFKDYDNQFRSVTVQDLETLALEISINGSNLYNQKFRMQNFVLNAETAEDLENFVIQFTMMDFTENN
jgi:hypothetical protein